MTIKSFFKTLIVAAILSLLMILPLVAQDYKLVWEDNFEGTSLNNKIWSVESEVGIWNTGANHELEHYRHENVTVGDDGNGNNCLIITAKKESYNGYAFTSGKVDTKGKFNFKYGKLVARIKMPDLANGLWPAFWLVGDVNKPWPDCGEIDIVEMGHKKGITEGTQNKLHGGALHWENADSYAGYGTTVNATTDLNNDFHLFTLTWDSQWVRMFLDDNTTPYFEMKVSGNDLEEFRDYSSFLIFNLAVGGQMPDIFTESGVTAPMPARMLIDYVKLYQIDGIGETSSIPKVYGNFGVYTETASVGKKLDFNFDASITTEGLTNNSSETPKEGVNVLAYQTQASTAFSVSANSAGSFNMSNYLEGCLSMYVKTDLTDDLNISITDADGGFASVVLTGDIAYNPPRDNAWQKVVIPIADFQGSINFEKINGFLKVSGQATASKNLAIDHVLWSESLINSTYYGLYTENPQITDRLQIDDNTTFLYIWDNTLTAISGATPYDGIDVLAFKDNGVGWYGFGVFSSVGVDISNFINGYLILTVKCSSSSNFWIGIAGANGTEGQIKFNKGADPYGFLRDGKYHTMVVPMSDLNAYSLTNTGKELDLSACGNVFMAGGDKGQTGLFIDDAYLSLSSQPIENVNIAKLTSITLSPSTATVQVGKSKKFTASGYNQFGNKMPIEPVWSSSENGFITTAGEFVGIVTGTFTVTATDGNISGTATVTVTPGVGINEGHENEFIVFPQPANYELTISGEKNIVEVGIYNTTGQQIITLTDDSPKVNIDISNLQNGIYILKIYVKNGLSQTSKFIKQ